MSIFDKFRKEKSEQNISETAKQIIDACGYKCQVFAENTEIEKIVDSYFEAYKRGQKRGFVPILVPVDNVLEDQLGIMKSDGYKIEESLQYLKSGKEILDERYKEYIGDAINDFEVDEDEFIGEYDGEPECMGSFSSLIDYRTRKSTETILFEIPTKNPWEVVAYIPFGGWNECPSPDEMVAICKYWYEEYGAIPTTITHDILEMRLDAPVDKEKALEVAKEHYAFTPDRVDQGTQTRTLSEVAASIATSKGWFFWWD